MGLKMEYDGSVLLKAAQNLQSLYIPQIINMKGDLSAQAGASVTSIFLKHAEVAKLDIGLSTFNKVVSNELSKPAMTVLKPLFEEAFEKTQLAYLESGGTVDLAKNAVPEPVKNELSDMYIEPVFLAEATMLRQPVKGTSGDSVYFTVAMAKGLNVAVRVKKDYQISIRAEGPDIADYGPKLAAAGLAQAGSGHYSLHLSGENVDLARKTIGSLLFATDIQFDGTFTDIDQLVGKGA